MVHALFDDMFKGVLGNLTGNDGIVFTVNFIARQRSATTWEGLLEFAGDDGVMFTTDVETTQPSVKDVENWARALSTAHLEGALARSRAPKREQTSPAGIHSISPTPVDPVERRFHLQEIESYVLRFLAAERAMKIPTSDIFRDQQYSNADLVRTFELLEKRFRFVVRATVDGIDWLYLTSEGARFLGIGHESGGAIEAEPRRPAR